MSVHFDFYKNGVNLFKIPKLHIPNREPDFIIDDSEHSNWPCVTEYYIEERILVFCDHLEGDETPSRILVDERYGIFADSTHSQNVKSWERQHSTVHEAYANWLTSKELL